MLYIQKYSLRLGIFTFGILSFSILAFNVILNPSKVNAAAPSSQEQIKSATFKFIDRANIEATIGDQKYIFFDGDIGDTTYHYDIQGSDCYGKLMFKAAVTLENQAVGGAGPASGFAYIPIDNIDIDYTFTGPDGCNNTSPGTLTGNVSTNGGHNIWFKWLDSGAIQRVDGRDDETYVKPTLGGVSDRIFLRNSEGKCADIIIVNTSKTSMKIYRLEDYGANGKDQLSDIVKEDRDLLAPVFDNDKCEVKGTYPKNGGELPKMVNGKIAAESFTLGGTADANNPAGTGYNGEAAQEDNSCESNGNLAWMMCPVAILLDATFGELESQIQSLLLIESDRYRHADLEKAWINMRNIAYIILVPIMLVMVIGTALGFGFLDAYTVKRALPRMLIAVLFITLSWEITGFLVELTNVVGLGIKGLILTPFGLQDGGFAQVFNPTAVQSAGQWVFLGAGALVVKFSSTVLGIVISFLGTAALILLTIFIFLVARQMFIMALIVFAPLAILAWIFPNNDKLWKSWWNIFSKLLLMFPLIMALTSMGLVFATLVGPNNEFGSSGGEHLASITKPLTKVAAFVIPFAMIPLSFKFVGGVVGNLAGMAGDKSRGAFDRLKKGRAAKYSRGWKETKAGTLTNRGGRLGGAVGTGLSTIASGPRGWASKKRRAGFRATALTQAGAEFVGTDPTFEANKTDDKFLLALADKKLAERKRDATTGQERAVWDQSIATAGLVKNQSRATRMAAAHAWAGSGYNFSAGQEGYNELAHVVASASGAQLQYDNEGNAVGATGANAGAYGIAMNNAQYNLKNASRFDLAGINYGAGYDYKRGIDKAGGYQAGQAKPETHVAGAESLLGSGFVRDGATLAAPEFTRSLRHRVEAGSMDLGDLAIHHRNLLDAFSGATGANKTEIGKQLDAIEAVTSNRQATPNDEQTLNNILAAQAVVEKNKRDVYRGQPQDRAILNDQNNPPGP